MSRAVLIAMRRAAHEADIFFRGWNNRPGYVETYYPKIEGESYAAYNNRPKLNVNVTAAQVNALADLLHSGLEVTVPPEHEETWEAVQKETGWKSRVQRKVFVSALSTGNAMPVIRVRPDNTLMLEVWEGKFLDREAEGEFGYEFYSKEGTMLPVFDAEPARSNKDEGYMRVRITAETFEVQTDPKGAFVAFPHFFPFAPAVWFESVDQHTSGLYATPFPQRWLNYHGGSDLNNLAMQYNKIVSQAFKAITILQNVWVTNKDGVEKQRDSDVGSSVTLAPEAINYLGQDGKLEQAVRNLTLTPEWEYIEHTARQLSTVSQIPGFLTGLEGLGKIADGTSGIALSIYFRPLTRLKRAASEVFEPQIETLVDRLIRSRLLLDGKPDPGEIGVSATIGDDFIPTDRDKELRLTIELLKASVIDAVEARAMMERVQGFKLEELFPDGIKPEVADDERRADQPAQLAVDESPNA